MNIEQRKKDHVRLCAEGSVGYEKPVGFNRFDFVHNALPEIDLEEVSVEASLLGRKFSFPLFVSSMTGGYSDAGAVNAVIASFCQKFNLPFGVGSQRAMLENPASIDSFSVVREKAPDAFIAANIGGSQLIGGPEAEKIKLLVDSIRADAVIVHLNPLQELMQPEGDRKFRGILGGIKNLVDYSDLPVIVKETGAGINAEAAVKLKDAGVKVIDIAGAGGTSWSKVENRRAGIQTSPFDEWGNSTVDCLLDIGTEELGDVEIIASGGIRSAFDMAKAMCLGAHFAATAQPVLKAVIEGGEEKLASQFENWKRDFRMILCLLGVASPAGLDYKHIRTNY